jgi:RHH-type rel operon transcriptional repressor/antitoxin RelB
MRRVSAQRGNQEQSLRGKSEKSSQVIAVRVEPMIEQRLRLLAETTGQSQSFFLKQLIEDGIAVMEAVWLPKDVSVQIRSGVLPPQLHGATLDLFGDPFRLDLFGDPIREDRTAK